MEQVEGESAKPEHLTLDLSSLQHFNSFQEDAISVEI
jgi:hypothetical protein